MSTAPGEVAGGIRRDGELVRLGIEFWFENWPALAARKFGSGLSDLGKNRDDYLDEAFGER